MSYKDEIETKLKCETGKTADGYTVTVCKGYAVIEGHKGILAFDPSHISVRLRRGIAEIYGEEMTIASSQKEEIVIKGRITEISFDKADKK